MNWHHEWQALCARIQGLLDAGTFFYSALQHSSEDDRSVRKKILLKNAEEIFSSLNDYLKSYQSSLPEEALASLQGFLEQPEIKDFNFNPLPSNFTFRTDFDRNYNEVKLRNVFEDVDIKIDSTVNKNFLWNRFYDLRWDITRALKIDFSATNVARIDEMPGAFDWFRPGDNREWSDSIWTNILNGGTNTNYDHSFNVTYTIPFSKFPVINWVSSSVRYNGKMIKLNNNQLG